MTIQLGRILAALAIMTILSATAFAQEITTGLAATGFAATGEEVPAGVQWATDLSLGHTDNVRRTNLNQQGEDLAQADVEYYFLKKTRRVDAAVAADLGYVDYLSNSYSNSVIGSLSGNAAANLVEDRLRWTVQDNFGQAHRDLLLSYTPQNRENINYVSTGPDLLLPLANNTDLDLNARYSRVDYQISPLSSNRDLAALALIRHIAGASSLSLNATAQRVDYQSPLTRGADFDRSAIYAAYTGGGSKTDISISAGVNEISNSVANASGPLLQLVLTRRVSAYSRMTFGLGQLFTDSGTAFGTASVFTNVTLDTQALGTSASPYKLSTANLGWEAIGSRTRLGASASWNRETYLQQATSDRDLASAEVHLARQLSSRLDMRLTASDTDTKFKLVTGNSQDSRASAALNWQAGQRLHLGVLLDHYHRNSQLAGVSYTENRIWLSLRYGDAFVRGVGAFGVSAIN